MLSTILFRKGYPADLGDIPVRFSISGHWRSGRKLVLSGGPSASSRLSLGLFGPAVPHHDDPGTSDDHRSDHPSPIPG